MTDPGPTDGIASQTSDLTLGFATRSWRNAGKEGVWVVIGQVMTAVAGLAGLRLLTELATKELIGQASMLLGAFALLRNLFLAPVGNLQLRFHPEFVASGQAGWFTRTVTHFTWFGAAGLWLSLVAGLLVWRALDPGVSLMSMLAIATLMACTEVPRSVRLNWLSAERLRGASAVWSSTEAWLAVAGAACAVAWRSTSETYLAGQALGVLSGLLLFGVMFFPAIPRDAQAAPADGRERLKSLVVSYGLPFVPLALVGWISNLGDRYILAGHLGAAEVGVYSAAYGLASRPFLMVGGVMSGFARPILFQAEGQGRSGKANRIFALWIGITAAVSALGVFLFWLLGDRVAAVFLAEQFRHKDTTMAFVWVASGYSFMNLIQVLENRLLSKGVSSRLVLPSVAGAVFNVVANLVLIPRFGLLGAAQATAATFVLQAILVAEVSRAAVRERRVATGNP